jgi:hypothetical protein
MEQCLKLKEVPKSQKQKKPQKHEITKAPNTARGKS